ncbi:hypothetical protein Taro_013940 [Colocasia esculenta]|uniref:Uncharacterized protein n=1 Tax=Colocasia esculenta TaxID=4460 RepID=A0A843U7T0_COLES|nr:hypothetical protein [Colocasia esculenta]
MLLIYKAVDQVVLQPGIGIAYLLVLSMLLQVLWPDDEGEHQDHN